MIRLQGHSRIMNCDETVQIKRAGTVEWIDGKNVEIGSTTLDARVNIQPVDGQTLLLMPEADRTKEMYFVFTQTPLKLHDKVYWRGGTYRFQNIEQWGSFVECIMCRVDTGSEASV